MEQKEFLNGNLVIGKVLYNFLYTLLYVVVWLIIYTLLAFGLCELNDVGLINELPWHNIVLWIAVSSLTSYKFFHKNNYL